jgi:predicted metal-dependent HD superfamily phosphohydrolase
MIAYLSAAYANSGEIEKAQALVNELVQRGNAGEKGVNIYLVHAYHAMNNNTSAWQYHKKAKKSNDVDLIWWGVDPLLKKLKDSPIAETAAQSDFIGAENHIKSLLNEKMPSLQYHNISHIYDVLESAMIIAENEKLTDEEIKLLRIAALFHDVGFIQSSANHEEKGAAMAAEILFEYGFDEHQIRKIQNMIMATRIPQSPVDKLEKILCDADLDYLGRDDFYEIGGRLFEELKAHRIIETEREWNLVQKTFLESHRYHTEYSKAHRERFKKQRLNEIAEKLRMRA